MVETAIVLAMVAIFVAFIAPPITEALTAYESAAKGLNAEARVRYALERIAREVRQIRIRPSDGSRYDVTDPFVIHTNDIDFTKHDTQRVVIAKSGSFVTMNYTGVATTTLIDGVTAFTVAYYQNSATGTLASAGSDTVASIRFVLTISDDGVTHQGETRVNLRNSL